MKNLLPQTKIVPVVAKSLWLVEHWWGVTRVLTIEALLLYISPHNLLYIKWNRVFSMICFGIYDRIWLHPNVHTSLLYIRQKQYVKRAVFPNSQYS